MGKKMSVSDEPEVIAERPQPRMKFRNGGALLADGIKGIENSNEQFPLPNRGLLIRAVRGTFAKWELLA